jgi:protein-lysine N-methyltransferase EEF2KMT
MYQIRAYTPFNKSDWFPLVGITRSTVIDMMPSVLGNSVIVRRLSLAEFHTADEVFTTGTMGELTPVTCIDGRTIGDTGLPGPITAMIQTAYTKLTQTQGVPLP